MIPLAMAEPGDVNIIRKVSGSPEVVRHMADLGFVVGEKVTVISKIGQNMILSVKDSRVALDKSMTLKIMV